MSGHGHGYAPTSDVQMRDPDPKIVAQIGIVSAVLVAATVFAIQGLYFFFQHDENQRKAQEFLPDLPGVQQQKDELTSTKLIDKKSHRVQLQINVARTLVQNELAEKQK
ncbi:MAG: hypothetical protein AB7K09_09710 [Planctomycetota bacterium]